MNIAFFLLLSYVLILLLILLIVNLYIKLSKYTKGDILSSVEKGDDLPTLIEDMKRLVLESERIAESLDLATKKKEALLEDLSNVVDAKIKRFARLSESRVELAPHKEPSTSHPSNVELVADDEDFNDGEISLKENIIQLSKLGKDNNEISRKLNISITEVDLVLKFYNMS